MPNSPGRTWCPVLHWWHHPTVLAWRSVTSPSWPQAIVWGGCELPQVTTACVKCTEADDSAHTGSSVATYFPKGLLLLLLSRCGGLALCSGGENSRPWQLPLSVTPWHSPEEGDEELHQVHDAVVLRERNLEKEGQILHEPVKRKILRFTDKTTAITTNSIHNTAKQWCEKSWQRWEPSQEPQYYTLESSRYKMCIFPGFIQEPFRHVWK